MYVRFPARYLKTGAAGITKHDTEMSRDKFWKSIYFGDQKVKGQGYESQKPLPACVGLCTLVSAGLFGWSSGSQCTTLSRRDVFLQNKLKCTHNTLYRVVQK